MQFVLIDTVDVARVVFLQASTHDDAEAEAFSMIEPANREGCDTLEDYQDSLGPSQWYKVVTPDKGMPMSNHRYASGWRPEPALKETVLEMVSIVFDSSATLEECEAAAMTIVEAVCPEAHEPLELSVGSTLSTNKKNGTLA